ncbi:NUDIX domain-containing protein [Roseitranquillus sediminis]|uniref:NUDIX domain-containing protein n=1 Tax=Roseitranquillus sediminis TaxID=2809051 RepID=UPI001D0CA67E|nr:NUDIX domain-containing protein [Roseitranquillus sediminis]MBM9593813.1 NUDIX domain-containing protein [Roseitranquillus sediminis]
MSRSKLGNGIRRLGASVRPGVTYRTRPGVYAAALIGDGVLLTLQHAPRAELQLPGGGIDPGETPLAALHREVAEETGWRIGRCRRLGAYRRFTFMPEYGIWAEKVCMVYLARAVRWIAPPTEAGHEALVVPLSRAPSLVGSEGDAAFLKSLALSRSPRTRRPPPRRRP